jgi:hypothetical protein
VTGSCEKCNKYLGCVIFLLGKQLSHQGGCSPRSEWFKQQNLALRLGPQNGVFPFDFPTEILHALRSSPAVLRASSVLLVTLQQVTKLHASRPRNFTPHPPFGTAPSQQYNAPSFGMLRVASRLHSPGPRCSCSDGGRYCCGLEVYNLVTANADVGLRYKLWSQQFVYFSLLSYSS